MIRGLADAVGPLSLPGGRSIVRPSQRGALAAGLITELVVEETLARRLLELSSAASAE